MTEKPTKEKRHFDFAGFFFGSGLASRLTRLLGLLGFIATMDQLLGRFEINVIGIMGLSAIAFFSIIINCFLFVELLVFPSVKHIQAEVAQETSDRAFVRSLMQYAKDLATRGKVSTVLSLRESLSHLLHLLGEHSARTELGKMSFQAAVSLDDVVAKSEILIDDLGWANFQAGRRGEAETNIRRGIQELGRVPNNPIRPYILSVLLKAKAHRHLALMADDPQKSSELLDTADGLLLDLSRNNEAKAIFGDAIERDVGQVKHARATLIARRLGVADAGTIPAHDSEGVQRAHQALLLAHDAAVTFLAIGDPERATKAMYLEERMAAALGNETEVLEVQARRDKVALTQSIRKR